MKWQYFCQAIGTLMLRVMTPDVMLAPLKKMNRALGHLFANIG